MERGFAPLHAPMGTEPNVRRGEKSLAPTPDRGDAVDGLAESFRCCRGAACCALLSRAGQALPLRGGVEWAYP